MRAAFRAIRRSNRAGRPETALTRDYVGRLCAIRTAVLTAAGGLDPAHGAAAWYDAVLRVSEASDRVAHVPRVLLHRKHGGDVDAAGRGGGRRSASAGAARRNGRGAGDAARHRRAVRRVRGRSRDGDHPDARPGRLARTVSRIAVRAHRASELRRARDRQRQYARRQRARSSSVGASAGRAAFACSRTRRRSTIRG